LQQAPPPGSLSTNFGFLAEHDPLLLQLCAAAERYCHADPNTALLKVRQFGEALSRQVAATFGITSTAADNQADLLGQLQRKGVLDRDVAALLHAIRREGNEAAHQFETRPGQAREALKLARSVAIWFHRSFGKDTRHFKPGPFKDLPAPTFGPSPPPTVITLPDPGVIESLGQETARREAAERRLAELGGEVSVWKQLALDEERQRLQLQAEFDKQLAELIASSQARSAKDSETLASTMAAATQALDLDEAETRKLIDAQLREAGWEADSVVLDYRKGVRPEPGRSMAIAEWDTDSGPADYVLFVGLDPVAVVEAKKFGTDIASVLNQAERYSLGFRGKGEAQAAPRWPAGHATVTGATHYRVPFVYASNGRPYHRQFLSKSGVWFRDVRDPTNHGKALDGWHTPEGLVRMLGQDRAASKALLQAEPFDYLRLWKHQIKAVQAIEAQLDAGKRECLVAMATGTGKTRTVVGLLYRLLKAKRFHRVLFLVDRKDLGTQAQNAFKEFRLEQDRLANPPFGTKKGGGLPSRSDFSFPTSNKQLAFLEHIYRGLKPGGRAAVVLPDNVLFEGNVGRDIRADLMDKCNLHTILRLPTGIFYAQGVKTNVLFFQRNPDPRKVTGSTKAVWVYDLRANMPQFGKRTPFTREHLQPFVEAFGRKADGTSKRTDQGESGRWRCFTRESIKKRGDSLDISWLKDESAESSSDLPEPSVLAQEAMGELAGAMAELELILAELGEASAA